MALEACATSVSPWISLVMPTPLPPPVMETETVVLSALKSSAHICISSNMVSDPISVTFVLFWALLFEPRPTASPAIMTTAITAIAAYMIFLSIFFPHWVKLACQLLA